MGASTPATGAAVGCLSCLRMFSLGNLNLGRLCDLLGVGASPGDCGWEGSPCGSSLEVHVGRSESPSHAWPSLGLTPHLAQQGRQLGRGRDYLRAVFLYHHYAISCGAYGFILKARHAPSSPGLLHLHLLLCPSCSSGEWFQLMNMCGKLCLTRFQNHLISNPNHPPVLSCPPLLGLNFLCSTYHTTYFTCFILSSFLP